MKKLTIKKLLSLLAIMGSIDINKWNMVMEIVKAFPNVTVVSKEWCDSFKEKFPDSYKLDLSNINTWSTYDKCVRLKFSVSDGKLHCHALIYDGDILDGFPTDKRFVAHLIFEDKFIKIIEDNIKWEFESFADDAYDRYLETQKREWIVNFYKQFGMVK